MLTQNNIYSRIIILCILSLCTSFILQAQNYNSRTSLSEKARVRFIGLEKSLNVSLASNPIGTFDLQTLLQEEFTLRGPKGGNYQFSADTIIDRGNGLFSWIGRNMTSDYFSHYVVNLKNGGINGTVDLGNVQYDFMSLDHSKVVLLYNDDFKNLNCGVTETSTKKEKPKSNQITTRMAGQDCNQRAIIAYTPAAKAASNDIIGRIQAAIDYTNIAYENSNIDFEIEIAFVYETNYVETGQDVGTCWIDGLAYPDQSQDLCRFHHQGDGYMDEVHTYRDIYKADMCILMVDILTAGIGGESFLPPVINQGEAFAIVLWDNGIRTTAHEIGHIQGCHHDYNADPTWTNNHGYVHIGATVEESFKTVMAYDNQCNNNFGSGCRTIPFFSDPDIMFEGVPIGETDPLGIDGAMNAINIMNQKELIMGFRDYPSIHELPSITLTGQSFAYPVASNILSNAGTFSIQDSSDVHFRSENKIILKPGFHSDSIAFFEGRISTGCDVVPDVNPLTCSQYGYSIDIHGNFAVVGDPLDGALGTRSGAVYLYERVASTWELKQKIYAPSRTPDDRYGHSVSIFDSTFVVGAPGRNGAVENGGIAYIYNITDTTVVRLCDCINVNTTSDHDEFGYSVDIFQDNLVISAPGDITNGADAGSFLYYRKLGEVWFLNAEYYLPGGQSGDRFGESVGLGKSNLVIGVPGFDSISQDQGIIAAFRPLLGGGWKNTQKLSIDGLPANARLGSSVDLEYTRFIAGAPGDNKKGSKSGSAHTFRIIGDWSLEESFIPNDLKANDRYGYSVAIDSISTMITAPGTGLTSGIPGRTYTYSYHAVDIYSGTWNQGNTILQNVPWIGTYGSAVSIDKGRAFIGSLGDFPECVFAGNSLFYLRNGGGDWILNGPPLEQSFQNNNFTSVR